MKWNKLPRNWPKVANMIEEGATRGAVERYLERTYCRCCLASYDCEDCPYFNDDAPDPSYVEHCAGGHYGVVCSWAFIDSAFDIVGKDRTRNEALRSAKLLAEIQEGSVID